MNSLNPSLFIGSSSEGLPVARALQAELDDICEPRVWHQGVFGASETTIGALLKQAQGSDFAALILTPDDSATARGAKAAVARDNVIFELGLFFGALGARRVFIIRPRDQSLKLPSDLAGVTCIDYMHNRSDNNLQAAIGPASTKIRDRILSEGPRSERELPQPDQEATIFWLQYGKEVWRAGDAARRLLARLPEHVGRTLEGLAASLDEDLMVSSFSYRSRNADGSRFRERAVLMARRTWAEPGEPPHTGIGLGQSATPDPHRTLDRPFLGIYAADQHILDKLREHFGPSDEPWDPWAQWEYLILDPPTGPVNLLAHYATAAETYVRRSWKENIQILDRVIGEASV